MPLLFGMMGFGALANAGIALDSIGTEKRNGVEFIVHQVDQGETLFALSRKYGMHVNEIKAVNSENLSDLNVGQKVLIPYNPEYYESDVTLHTVKASETLFSISQKYDVEIEEVDSIMILKEKEAA